MVTSILGKSSRAVSVIFSVFTVAAHISCNRNSPAAKSTTNAVPAAAATGAPTVFATVPNNASAMEVVAATPKGSDEDLPERASLATFQPKLVTLADVNAVGVASGAGAAVPDPAASPDPERGEFVGWKRIPVCHKFDIVESKSDVEESKKFILVGATASTLGGKYTAGMVVLSAIPTDACIPIGDEKKAFGVLVVRKPEWLAAAPEKRRFELKNVNDLTWVNEWPWALVPKDSKLKTRTVHYTVAAESAETGLSFKRSSVLDTFEGKPDRLTEYP